MTRMDRISKNNTKITTDESGTTRVILHNTVIVTISRTGVALCHGGYKTDTTRTRINQTMNFYGFAIGVCQKKGIWYVRHNGTDHVWPDDRNVYVINR
jgi:hypothetical protein